MTVNKDFPLNLKNKIAKKKKMHAKTKVTRLYVLILTFINVFFAIHDTYILNYTVILCLIMMTEKCINITYTLLELGKHATPEYWEK